MNSGDPAKQLQQNHSARSTGTSSTFIAACPAGKLDAVGLPPVPKVFIRPASSKRSKPSALDKHLRHVVLLQRSNRSKTQQHASLNQTRHSQRQRFADWSHRLRTAILHRGSSHQAQHDSSPQPQGAGQHSTKSAQPLTASTSAAGAKLVQGIKDQEANSDDADVIQAWRPIAAAEQTKALQESIASQQQQLKASLPVALDPDTLRPKFRAAQPCSKPSCSSPTKAPEAPLGAAAAASAAAAAMDSSKDTELDVDAFLDGLLQTVTASQDTPASTGAAAHPMIKSQPKQSLEDPQSVKPQRPCSKGRAMPAWAVSEQQQAAAEAAAAAQEEQALLEFAQQLDLQELLQDLGDDELAAAFKDLELADAAAAEGDPEADKRWQHCFVTALNAAAMKGIATGTSSTAVGPDSQQGDKRSSISSASALRRAEAATQRRQQLIHRLHRLTGTTAAYPSALTAGQAAPAGAAAATKALSVCDSIGGGSWVGSSTAGPAAGGGAAGSAAGDERWESSTAVCSSADDVGRLKAAIKQLEAVEVLAENPELRGVHSTASVRSLLSRLEAAG